MNHVIKQIALRIMRLIKIFLLSLCSAHLGLCQCDNANLLSGKMGTSLYDCYNSLQLNKAAISVIKDPYQKYWKRYDYLKDDSVFYTQINLELKNPCDVGNEIVKGSYLFSDDKLYKIILKIRISKDHFAEGYALYKKFIAEIREKNYYKYSINHEIKSTDFRTQSKEKTGEDIMFFTSKLATQNDKLKYVSISFNHEFARNENTGREGDISEYVIELEKVDLQTTKLTNEGF